MHFKTEEHNENALQHEERTKGPGQPRLLTCGFCSSRQKGCRHQFSAVSAHGDTEGKSGLVVVVTELMSRSVS